MQQHDSAPGRRRTPSPALVVSIIALVVACSGTAVAAKTLITSSSQVKNGVLTGSDLRNGSVRNADIAKETISGSRLRDGTVTLSKLRDSTKRSLRRGGGLRGSSAEGGAVAIEAFRREGPEVSEGGARVATLRSLSPGTYAILAQTTLVTPSSPEGLGELLKKDRNATALCELEAAGDATNGRTMLGSLGQEPGGTLNLQITRTLARPGDVTLSCASNFPWRAGESSIIAIRLGSSERREVTG